MCIIATKCQSLDALDIYNSGWVKGDSATIYRVLAQSYNFAGLPKFRGGEQGWLQDVLGEL